MEKFIYSSDLNVFNKKVVGSLRDCLVSLGCPSNVRYRKIAHSGKYKSYRIDNTGLTFEIRHESY